MLFVGLEDVAPIIFDIKQTSLPNFSSNTLRKYDYTIMHEKFKPRNGSSLAWAYLNPFPEAPGEAKQ